MESDYACLGGAAAQMPGKNYANAATNGVRQPRTFDQIDHAVVELAELNKRLEAALDRLGHCANETCDNGETITAQKLGTDYSRSLSKLQREVRDLRSNVTALEGHI